MKKQLLLLIAAVALLGSDCEEQRIESLDEGFRQIGDLEVHTEIVPMGFYGDESFPENDLALLPAAVEEWWNLQMGQEWLYDDPITPTITAEVNYISLDEMPDNFMAIEHDVDLTAVEYSVYDGAMISCHIVLNVDLAYDLPTMEQGLRHALGHCFGLEDDPGIDVTVDLRSIMSNPLDPLGELTDHDRELLLEVLP
jgi:hypothetical protein